MEKILLYQNDISLDAAIDSINGSIEAVNEELKFVLTEIGMNLTNDTLADCLRGAQMVKRSYTAILVKDLKRLASAPLKNEMAEKASVAWNRFMLTCDRIQQSVKYKQYLTVEDGVCVLTPDNREKLAETFKVYITDPEEIAIFRAHQKACEALNQVFQGKLPLAWWSIFQVHDDGKLTMNLYTNYQRLAGKEEEL